MSTRVGDDGKALSQSRDDRQTRLEAGRQRRKDVARRHQSAWTVQPDRTVPLDILRAQGRARIPELLPIRYQRMRASAFAFLRGAAAVMAADVARTPTARLGVQACGDCHLANFGTFTSPEGAPVFDINDFDETAAAPFEWDVKRLATSFVLAARERGATTGEARYLAACAARHYAREMRVLAWQAPLAGWSVRSDLGAAIETIRPPRRRARVRDHLQQQVQSAASQFGLLGTDMRVPRFRDRPPLVMRLPEHDTRIRTAFARYLESLPAERRLLLERYALRDVIFKVVGVGSVGTYCAIGLFTTADGQPLLLQIKEASASVLEPFAGPSPYANGGERVVTGQRIMQATPDMFLGWTHEPDQAGQQARHFYVRRMKDGRMAQIGEMMEAEGLRNYAQLCGRTLARAHARSGDAALISGYTGRGRRFSYAIAEFALRYARQTHEDWTVFCAALDNGVLA
ncbi:hypothetical protein AA103196_2411 [Ameyamaea chiangmaiensis NBRC 103196]|uniref:DUF2252 domain-containing protein n=1 Tax=Ameyamaea chiangmaiensis TaxID=442969 RepID=A0A850P9G6_9PROT|nr:DUF2252 domain-containing protein [Ameyamaea chiangmaiensis]MBS4075334.1 DUF2252 domain-containing protein [Ameyamaea chiangmaiensis]NVN40674.1 DUF2252 domain-containing protein [Ameyamaea chiangmaiensis]GBQ70146.1 hypothetical protein AA103196_2411 [Ameyamaea chiangmaiensis NBRC 103196]